MHIDQIAILVFGATGLFLTQCRSERLRRIACLVGLAGQPFWFYAAIYAQQWGILAANVLYTVAWLKGVWVHWVQPWWTARQLRRALEKQWLDTMVYGSGAVSVDADGKVRHVPFKDMQR